MYLVRWCWIPNIKVLGIVISDKMICFIFSQYRSKAEGKTQKSIQSSSSTDPRHSMGKWTPHAREPRDQPFPSRWSHAYVKYATSMNVPFTPQGYNLWKRGGDLLGYATYQILRLYALWFQTRRFSFLCNGLNYLNNYLRGSYKNHSCKVRLKSS